MAKVSLLNMAGDKVGDVELKTELFGIEPSIPLMHQAVVTEQANSRQGTHDTKNRDEVSGGGRKPFRQKGTGRARQGSTRSPHMYHGGIVFGPTPRSYSKAFPKKMKRGAIRSAFSARLADDVVIVVDEVKFDSISTKNAAAFLSTLDASGKALVILGSMTEEIRKSFRNIAGVSLRVAPAVSVRDVLDAEKIVLSRAAVDKLQEVFA
jgi:large subunit ribosomal protein L4